VARLRAAGCVVIGKTTTPEFGWQGDTTSPAFGPTRNPWNLERSPGGSSGGTAAAVAAGMIPLGTGSDGGGSIRIPSALCGLAGFKPTTGRIGLGGAHAPGSGVLTVKGPMARTVRDVAYALDVCVGPEPTDPFSFPGPDGGPGWFQALATPAPPRTVLFAPAPGFTVDAEIAAVCAAAVDRIAGAGVEVDVIDRVFTGEPLGDWFTVWCVLAARRQGDLKGTADWDLIDPGLREQIDYALSTLDAVGFARALDATYTHNLDLVAHFERAPIIVCPTVAGQTGRSGEQGTVNGEATVFWSPFTPSYNLTRNPVGSVPVGLTTDGMPVGLQVIGAHGDDLGVLHTMAFIEDLLALDLVAPTA
jgi:aspartyl-tRNA(Asn)/glutamyl-tRNA(Gln) amidotransferase subunit A